MSVPSVPSVLTWLFCPACCPAVASLAFLFLQSYPGCPVLRILSWLSFPGCLVLAVPFKLSYPGSPVLAVHSWLFLFFVLIVIPPKNCVAHRTSAVKSANLLLLIVWEKHQRREDVDDDSCPLKDGGRINYTYCGPV